jgi:hypothetical protein
MSGNPDWATLLDFAQKWPTCACGNQDAAIERNFDGAPVDTVLLTLGSQFMYAIQDRRIVPAIEILQAIEKRAAELLAQQAV